MPNTHSTLLRYTIVHDYDGIDYTLPREAGKGGWQGQVWPTLKAALPRFEEAKKQEYPVRLVAVHDICYE